MRRRIKKAAAVLAICASVGVTGGSAELAINEPVGAVQDIAVAVAGGSILAGNLAVGTYGYKKMVEK
jgi:hypothetical protein